MPDAFVTELHAVDLPMPKILRETLPAQTLEQLKGQLQGMSLNEVVESLAAAGPALLKSLESADSALSQKLSSLPIKRLDYKFH